MLTASLETSSRQSFLGTACDLESSIRFISPVESPRVTSLWDDPRKLEGGGYEKHQAIDFSLPVGSPVYAVAAATVVRSAYNRDAGNMVVLSHGNGVFTRYLHLKRSLVIEGQCVSKGDVIALSGNTGKSDGPHLHFDVQMTRDLLRAWFPTVRTGRYRSFGYNVNPKLFIPTTQTAVASSWDYQAHRPLMGAQHLMGIGQGGSPPIVILNPEAESEEPMKAGKAMEMGPELDDEDLVQQRKAGSAAVIIAVVVAAAAGITIAASVVRKHKQVRA